MKILNITTIEGIDKNDPNTSQWFVSVTFEKKRRKTYRSLETGK